MLKHGENIIDTLGAEVDRLEKELKVLKDDASAHPPQHSKKQVYCGWKHLIGVSSVRYRSIESIACRIYLKLCLLSP